MSIRVKFGEDISQVFGINFKPKASSYLLESEKIKLKFQKESNLAAKAIQLTFEEIYENYRKTITKIYDGLVEVEIENK